MSRLLLLLPILLAGCGPRLPSAVERPVDYAADVRPILQKHCYRCHGPHKQKGDYRLDEKTTALKADVVRLGDSSNSPLIHHLIGSHDRSRMPPEKPFLTDEQIGILRTWIDRGAVWEEITK